MSNRNMFGPGRMEDLNTGEILVCRAEGNKLHFMIVVDNKPGWTIVREQITTDSVGFKSTGHFCDDGLEGLDA